MDKLRCILVEDEQPAVDILQTYIENFSRYELVGHFTNGFDAREYLLNNRVDVLFLDIQLPGMSGMDFLRVLNPRPLVIITSAYEQHALEAFDLEVFDYLLKPYSITRFSRTIHRIDNHLKNSQSEGENTGDSMLVIKTGRSSCKVNASDIYFIESKREYLDVVLKDETILTTRMTMQEILEILPQDFFMRIHRSFIVGLSAVKSIGPRTTLLKTGKELPVGRAYRESVRNYLKG